MSSVHVVIDCMALAALSLSFVEFSWLVHRAKQVRRAYFWLLLFCTLQVITTRSELRKVLFLVLSVTFCLCMKYLGNR